MNKTTIGATVAGLIVMLGVLILFENLYFFDKQGQNYVQTEINQDLKSKNIIKLKQISADTNTFKALVKSKNVKVDFISDNQGSENIAYYPVKINNSKRIYGAEFKFSSMAIFFNTFSGLKIKLEK